MTANPFVLLGIDARYDIDLGELEKKHRDVSRALHPDRYVGRPASERREALGRAIEVNEAARQLKNPITRGEALLVVNGFEILEGGGADMAPPPALLMEVMELREALRDAGRRADVDAVEALRAKVGRSESASRKELSGLFSAPNLDEVSIRAKLSALRYYRRFFDEADAILDEIG